ncbi:MAG TPA: caspase family protein [Burkholderiaceae bacterium]|nr:caspase family protein [Burkholderiaceae bacterium]
MDVVVNSASAPRSVALQDRRRFLRGFGAALSGAAACHGLPRAARAALGDPTGFKSALVIGNGAYKVSPLKNPVADARAVAASLAALGFVVELKTDTTRRDLIEGLRAFTLAADRSAVRVLFYAGHGVQAKGRNYLLPVDTEPTSEAEIPAMGADAAEFIDRLGEVKHGINVVILDACRVNPFAGGVIVGPDGRRLKFRGLTPSGLAPLDAPIGTLVAFSTAPGGVALDGPVGEHSIYAKHLLQHLPTPGLAVEQLFKRVRIEVAQETGRVQVPWESSSLTADFCFRPGRGGNCDERSD